MTPPSPGPAVAPSSRRTSNVSRLHPADVDAIARRTVELLTGTDAGLVTATELARRLGVDRSWVYRNSRALGAVRLGTGKRARLRFDPMTACSAGKQSEPDESPAQPAKPRGRPRARSGTSGPLLPIRGPEPG